MGSFDGRSGVSTRPRWIRYGAALLIQVALCGFLQWLHPYFPLGKFPAPYAAVLLFTVLLYGEGPALLSLVLGFAMFYYCFTPPEYSWTLPQNADTWASVAAYVIVNGTVIVAIGFIQRGRHRVERLMESLQEHVQLLDLAHVFVRDANDRIIIWNKGLEALYGFTREEALGKVSHDLFGTVFPQSKEALYESLQKTGHWEGELTHTAKDGSKVVVASHQIAHRDAQGNLVAILEANNDITGRMQAQRALEKALQDLAAADQDKDVMNEELRLRNDELLREVLQRKHAEEETSKLAAIVEFSGDAIIGKSLDGIITSWNTGAEMMYGYSGEEIIGHSISVLVPPDRDDDTNDVLEKIRRGESAQLAETERMRKDGERICVSVTVSPVKDASGRVVGASAIDRDITEPKRAQQEREMTVELLQVINKASGIDDLIRTATEFFQEESGCEAVGIRLRDGDDYPYYEARGFPESFVAAENSLCARDGDCQARDSQGYPICECMCGNVIQARFDPCKPFFSEHGSFWTNSTTELLATSTEADRLARTRNRCNGEGYESVALIPIHVGNERLGLVQLNDRRKGMFSASAIGLWERFADYLAVALTKFQAEEALRESEMHKRDFYRQTILAATDGKLVISERDEVESAAGEVIREWQIATIDDVGIVRVQATAAARELGMDETKIYDFMACVVESAGNAAKHAKGGRASLYQRDGKLLFVVSDAGPGISAMKLPDVALTRGYTTAGTLGMGYKVMISFSDKVYLATGPDGTTVALEMAMHPSLEKQGTSIPARI